MARLEDNDQPDQVQQLASEVSRLKKQIKRKKSKQLLGCGNCILVFIIILLCFSYFTAYLIARSGLMIVPVLSDWYFIKPVPSRIVEPVDFSESEFIDQLKKDVQQAAIKEGRADNINLDIRLTESQLTTLLQNKIRDNQDLSQQIENIQSAVLEDKLEIFVDFIKPENLYLTVKIAPEYENNKLELNTESIFLGNLKIPKVLGNIFFANVFDTAINTSLKITDKYGVIENIVLLPGTLKFEVIINSLKLLQ